VAAAGRRLRIQVRLAAELDILSGRWKQMRGQVKQWRGKLTDDDLDRIDGRWTGSSRE
jgi:hypothetical protein